MFEKIDFIERKLRYTFDDLDLLHQALTHKSGVNEGYASCHNEALAWLGQSLLSASMAEILYDIYPNYDEGSLTEKRAELLSKQRLFNVAKTLGLHKHSFCMGFGERRQWDNNKPLQQQITVQSFKALLGAVFIESDGDFSHIKEFVADYWIIAWSTNNRLLGTETSNYLDDLAMTPKCATAVRTLFGFRVHVKHNERLEFLGDALLGAAVSYQLYQTTSTVSQLTQRKAELINNKQLADCATYNGLDQRIRLRGETIENIYGLRRERLLANCYEASLAVRYLTQRRKFSSLKTAVFELIRCNTLNTDRPMNSSKATSYFYSESSSCHAYAEGCASNETLDVFVLQ